MINGHFKNIFFKVTVKTVFKNVFQVLLLDDLDTKGLKMYISSS